MNKQLSRTLISVCIAAFAATAAVAQTPAGTGPQAAPGPGKHHMEHAFARPNERVEARLAYIKTALKISDAQQTQWDAYANLSRKNAQDMEQRFKARRADAQGRPPHQRPNAIERLERAQSFHAELVTRINQLLAVEKPLYAALSPEQQKVADVVLNRRGRPMGGPAMHGRGGFGRG